MNKHPKVKMDGDDSVTKTDRLIQVECFICGKKSPLIPKSKMIECLAYVCGVNGCSCLPLPPDNWVFVFHPNAAGSFSGVDLRPSLLENMLRELGPSDPSQRVQASGGAWQVLSPDQIATQPTGFNTREEAEEERLRFIAGFREQGFYLTADGRKISPETVERLTVVMPIELSDEVKVRKTQFLGIPINIVQCDTEKAFNTFLETFLNGNEGNAQNN